MHFKNKPLLDSNMNKTYKSPSTDEVDSLLLKRAEYAKKYPRPRKSSSPKSSPKLSSNKRDYWKLKSAMMNSSLRDTFDNLLQNDEDDSSKLQERLNESTSIQKTKSKWYNALYPTYKSRVEEFKRTFENIPDNERLIVDYSCGLQKDVLVHGRLYISQNYFCFYSNSYMTETSITLPWIDIASITKDKSSLMPNGILISTETDKLFLTTFGARDKTYSIMFRIWKSALINQPITDEEMWQLIHSSYGDELGLTSDDEEEKNFPSKYLGDSFSEFEASFMAQSRAHSTFSVPHESLNVSLHMNSKIDFSKDLDNNNTTTESESENENYKTLPKDHPVCTSQHEGRELINTTLPINIDQLFILLFTGSKFFSDFHASRKTTDLIQSSWIKDPETGAKTRNITMTVSLTQPVGPKTSKVTENQVMLPCSLPGSKYCIDIETLNSGIPYADSFSVETHFCMTSLGDEETNIKINSNVNFKKHVWAMMKSLILKNCWNGLEEFYGSLVDAVAVECEGIKKKTDDIEENTKKNETYVFDDNMKKTKAKVLMNEKKTIGFLNNNNQGIFKGNDDSVTIISWVLLAAVMFLMIINGLLYYKLWGLEDAAAYTVMDLHVLRKTPKSEEEWINLLQQQESLHNVEMRKWQRVLHTAAQLLKQTEESLTELRKSMHPTESEKVFSVLKEHF